MAPGRKRSARGVRAAAGTRGRAAAGVCAAHAARRARVPRHLQSRRADLRAQRAHAHGEAERRLRAWQGEGAAEHLFMTAAGLDSACVGETEIVGQVRYSQERALELGLCGPSLGLVFEEALRIAGRVRGGTKLAEGRV